MIARENAATKARRYLTEGRVILTRVDESARVVVAKVRGDGMIHTTRFRAGRWSCDCDAVTDQCAHCRAVRLVTAIDVRDRL